MRRRRNHPEWRGDGTAKALELKRVKRVRQQQLEQAQRRLKELEEKSTMQTTTPSEPQKKKAPRPRLSESTVKPFSSEQLRDFEKRISDFGGFDAVCEWYATTPVALITRSPAEALAYARTTVKCLRTPGARHNATGRNQLAHIMRDLGKPQGEVEHRVVAQTVEVKSPEIRETELPTTVERPVGRLHETGIVQWAGDFEFRLPSLSRAGAEEARITLTHLSEKLGYSDKAQLKELAKRHASNLSRFGETLTVKVSVRQGFTCRDVDELLFNEGQTLYLMTESGTPTASQKKADFILAVMELRKMFEKIVQHPQTSGFESLLLQMMDRQDKRDERRDYRTEQLFGAVLERLPRTRTRSAKANAAQQELPKPELRLVEEPPPPVDEHKYTVARAKLMDNPRLWNIPKPGTIKDIKIMDEFELMIDIYGMVSGLQSEKYSTAYDPIQRWDPKLRDRKDETKIAYIRSQSAQYKREAYRLAYGALVAPYLKAAS